MRLAAVTLFSIAFAIVGCESSNGKTAAPAPTNTKTDDTKTASTKTAGTKTATPAGDAAAGSADVEARKLFSTRCATCHGAAGKGDGPASAGLNPKPRDYSDAAWQKSVTDDDLRKVILEGGAAVGKSPLMPPNPDLKEKPEVVSEIVKLIRSFGG